MFIINYKLLIWIQCKFGPEASSPPPTTANSSDVASSRRIILGSVPENLFAI
jgi:hypothetical protein